MRHRPSYTRVAGPAVFASRQRRRLLGALLAIICICSGTTSALTQNKQAQPGEIQLGRDLFEGSVRFANGGPACTACHNVISAVAAGGGALAIDLTQTFSRLGAAGLRAIIAGKPFPAMQAAYAGGEFSESEISALTVFLQKTDQDQAGLTPKNWELRLFSGGVVSLIVFAGLAGLAGRGRKRRSVNQDIYDRQIR